MKDKLLKWINLYAAVSTRPQTRWDTMQRITAILDAQQAALDASLAYRSSEFGDSADSTQAAIRMDDAFYALNKLKKEHA